VNAQTVTLNTDERLYIIPCDGGGFSCHGFDVVANLTRKLKDWRAESGINALQAAFYTACGITGETPNEREENFREFCRNNCES
jgi:hypothetical protein